MTYDNKTTFELKTKQAELKLKIAMLDVEIKQNIAKLKRDYKRNLITTGALVFVLNNSVLGLLLAVFAIMEG